MPGTYFGRCARVCEADLLQIVVVQPERRQVRLVLVEQLRGLDGARLNRK